MKTISLYIHIPFCVRKCLYCDFLSFSADKEKRSAYLKALKEEIALKGSEYKDYEVNTVFFGGGTPSILSGDEIMGITDAINSYFNLRDNPEISMEINPGTEHDVLSYRKSGINRLSIGLQSANEQELKKLGRIHGLSDFETLYEQVLSNGFTNVNVDLMYGIPGQTLSSYERSLKYLADNPRLCKPTHVSAYSLSVEEGTPFSKMKLDLPDEEDERRMYAMTDEILSSSGFKRYEISNHALPGYECEHNKVYWKRGNYLGLGLGASSMVQNVRWKNTDDMDEYLKHGFLRVDVKELSLNEQMEEFMFLGLRMMEGVSLAQFKEIFGIPLPERYGQIINKYISMKLLKMVNECVMLTEDGISVSNVIMADFLE
ncbi:MAG: radical SAM family heme chaperone HemW [Lachnospiraceae bacterium]|nr:radical SAM family heme chaperone HemW [Lachnospiraceae bacterium]